MQFIDNYHLKNLTTTQLGGPAKKFAEVKTKEELIEAIKFAKGENLPFLVIGGGSNLLVSDEGFDGLVIKNEIIGMEINNNIIVVKSGTILQKIVDFSIQNGLSGLEKLTGIPGTIGGAVCGNSGAFGTSTGNHTTQVLVLDPSNLAIKQFNNSECSFSYRSSIFKDKKYIILEVKFQLTAGDKEVLQKEAEEILRKRIIKYPAGIKCPGSFFKNLLVTEIPKDALKNIPPEKINFGKVAAACLLDMVGAKGQKLDGIKIASYHANLFINSGNGTASAFYNLAKEMQDKVKEKFGITLVPEVQLIGKFPGGFLRKDAQLLLP